MKKIIPIFLILMVSLSIAADVTITRTMPDSVEPGKTLEVKFDIFPTKAINGFDLADLIPRNWDIDEWSVTGVDKADVEYETKAQSYGGATYMANHWKFPEISAGATLTYTLTAPSSEGSYDFAGIWTYPGGFDSDSKTLSVAEGGAVQPPAEEAARCGDGSCDSGEDCTFCPADCGECSVAGAECGDGACDSGESCSSCQSDCGKCPKGEGEGVSSWVYLVIILIILAGIGYYYYSKQPKDKRPSLPKLPKPKKGPKGPKGGPTKTYDKIKKIRLD